ncbi:hypothetical protein [Salinisphaera sp. LB1]|uniref:hypothetical protein n=1 Tax=Salinisphaera sp. LB1 TaxID=2183911 RepID=UPI0011AB633A|nr:hypothetical protein [Salinisphaera sp. LB1]
MTRHRMADIDPQQARQRVMPVLEQGFDLIEIIEPFAAAIEQRLAMLLSDDARWIDGERIEAAGGMWL